MGLFDNGTTINSLLNLVRSPRVQAFGNQATRIAMLQIGGPFSGRTPSTSYKAGSSGFSNAGASIGQTLGNLLGKNSGNQPQGQQQVDPMMALYQQLIGQLQSPVDMPQGVDTEDLMEQVKRALNPIYDQRAQQATGRNTKARSDIESLYGQLAQNYVDLAPEQVAQADAAKSEIEQMYGQLRSNIQGDYARVSDNQAELFKQLGIEDALPEVLAEQNPAVNEALTAAAENQTQQEQRYMDIGQMDSTFMREGSPLSKMRGTEVSSDMLAQLQDYLNQNDAERTSAIQSGYMDQLGQANSQLAQQQQLAQTENARRQEMLFQMLQSGMNQKQQPVTADTFMAQLDPNSQQAVAGAYTRLQRSPEAVYGKVEDKRNPVPGTYVETTPEWYMAQADEMLKRGEIDESTHQLLLMYLQLTQGSK